MKMKIIYKDLYDFLSIYKNVNIDSINLRPVIIKQCGMEYEHPVATAQMAIKIIKNSNLELLENQRSLLFFADRLLNLQTTYRNINGCFIYPIYFFPYKLQPPWISAMAQGEAIYVFYYSYKLTNNQRYLEASKKALEPFKYTLEEGGVVCKDKNGIWLEEYPSIKYKPHVLNGMIFALHGLMVYYYKIEQINWVEELIIRTIQTLRNNIHRYNAGIWSKYDLAIPLNLASLSYQILHSEQLKWLYEVSKMGEFRKYSNIFLRQYENTIYSFISQRVVRNIRRLLNILKYPRRIIEKIREG